MLLGEIVCVIRKRVFLRMKRMARLSAGYSHE